MSVPEHDRPIGFRRRGVLVATLAVLAVVACVLVGWAVGGPGDTSNVAGAVPTATGPTTSAPTTSAPTTSPPTPAGPTDVAPAPAVVGEPVAADELPPSLPPVDLDDPTETGGVTVELVAVEAIEGTGRGPGNVAGPAVRVTVRLDNGSADPLDLFGVAVDLAYGEDGRPGPTLDDPSAAPFSGRLAPGDSAEGVYVFRVPPDARDDITVSVGHQPGAAYVVFTGAVG